MHQLVFDSMNFLEHFFPLHASCCIPFVFCYSCLDLENYRLNISVLIVCETVKVEWFTSYTGRIVVYSFNGRKL